MTPRGFGYSIAPSSGNNDMLWICNNHRIRKHRKFLSLLCNMRRMLGYIICMVKSRRVKQGWICSPLSKPTKRLYLWNIVGKRLAAHTVMIKTTNVLVAIKAVTTDNRSNHYQNTTCCDDTSVSYNYKNKVSSFPRFEFSSLPFESTVNNYIT